MINTSTRTGARRAVAVLAGATLAAGALAGCTATDGGQDDGEATIAYLLGMKGLAFYEAMQCGALAAGEDLGVNVVVDGPQDFDATQQQTVLQSMLVNAPDGLVVVPDDPTALNVTLQQEADRIPVVTTDGTLSEQIGIANIRSNAFEGGALAADYMADALGGSGVVQAIGINPTFETNVQRVQGFMDRMAEQYPDITVLEVQYGGGDPSGASQVVSGILQSNPDLDGVYAPYEAGATGAAQAVAAAGLQGTVKLVGFDSSPAQIQALEDGTIDALVLQAPYDMGYEAVKLVAQVIDDPSAADGVEWQQYTASAVATKANMNDDDIARLLTPPTC